MNKSYDVAIVGAGAAGCVVAARLAETSSRSVLLIEAGPDARAAPPPAFRNGWGLGRGIAEWGYMSEPGISGEPQIVRRTRMVGGTSWLTRFWVRGAPADFDAWSSAGNRGWSYDELLPYFTRAEEDVDFGDEPWHGASGRIPITRYLDTPLTHVAAAATMACLDNGVEEVDDHNRPGAVGVGRMPMSSRGGKRVTTADAYLPVESTPVNLTIASDSLVDKVLFDDSQARGVRLADGSEIDTGWVVLCAGTYGSPTVLLRSGIGPGEDLASLGITQLTNLSGVGANLADHPSVSVACGETTGRDSPALHVIATFHSSGRSTDDTPDLMLWMPDPPAEAAPYEIEIVLLRPQSRGSVCLRSPVAADAPMIRLPALDAPADVQRLIEGVERAREVANHAAMREVCGVMPTGTTDRDQLAQAIRRDVYSIPHTVGTCAMGPRPDNGAVVDSDGTVHGVARLTICDASVIPDAPSGFTHAPIIAIAERLAERLKTTI